MLLLLSDSTSELACFSLSLKLSDTLSATMEARCSNRKEEQCTYEQWLSTQQDQLVELQKAVDLNEKGGDGLIPGADELLSLLERIMDSFQDYIDKRNRMARRDPSIYYAPPWCSSLENSVMWIGGCRPSSYIRLVYALCGRDIESQLADYLRGKNIGNLGALSAHQVNAIDQLHRRILREEKQFQDRWANLQEDVADQPLAAIAMISSEDGGGQFYARAKESLSKHGEGMAALMLEADRFRLNTTKELILNIMEPAQAVNFLAVGIRLRLCMRDWGKKTDHHHTSSSLV